MGYSHLTAKGIGELQKSAERFETYNDNFILPDHFIVVRLDAHRLGDWGIAKSEYPCGQRATAAFHDTAIALMAMTYRVVLAYHHGDEISVLLDPSENSNPIRRSKIISAFCSAAAVSTLQSSNLPALFDAKISELPSLERVLEYFLWQRRYCFRNALTIALRSALLAQGLSPERAEREIHGVSEEARLQKLKALNAPISNVPLTTRRGALFLWERSRNSGKEQLCIRAERALPEDDNDFLNLIASALEMYRPTNDSSRGRVHEAKATPTATNTSEPRPTTTTKAPQKHSAPTTPAKPQRTNKSGSKSNTSVFKMAGNS